MSKIIGIKTNIIYGTPPRKKLAGIKRPQVTKYGNPSWEETIARIEAMSVPEKKKGGVK